jgi:hypothetical protein
MHLLVFLINFMQLINARNISYLVSFPDAVPANVRVVSSYEL